MKNVSKHSGFEGKWRSIILSMASQIENPQLLKLTYYILCPVNESKTPWITILTRSSPLLCDMILLFTIYDINYAYIRYLERNFWIYIKPFVFSILNLLTWQCLVIKLYSKIKFILSCCAVIGCSKCRGFQHEFDIIWVLFTLFDTTDHESTHDSLLPVR